MRRTSLLLSVFFTCFVLGTSAQKSKIISFDVPGAGTAAYQGTYPYGINARERSSDGGSTQKAQTMGYCAIPAVLLRRLVCPAQEQGQDKAQWSTASTWREWSPDGMWTPQM